MNVCVLIDFIGFCTWKNLLLNTENICLIALAENKLLHTNRIQKHFKAENVQAWQRTWKLDATEQKSKTSYNHVNKYICTLYMLNMIEKYFSNRRQNDGKEIVCIHHDQDQQMHTVTARSMKHEAWILFI